MSNASEHSAGYIYARVMNELQNADEMGGPDAQEYAQLMGKVAGEAMRRRDSCLAMMRGNAGDVMTLEQFREHWAR